MKEFIKENRKFWSEFTIKNTGQKLLIEEPGWAMILHVNSIFAMIINQAKGYLPVWLCEKNSQEHQLLRSYFPNVEILTDKMKWLPAKLRAVIIAIFKFIKIIFTKNLLGFRYDKVKYGDIVYDVYLFENKVATIKKIDFKIFKIIAKCIFRHIKIKNILQNGNYAGVLVSHQVGICGGVMLRTALRYGYRGYLHGGHHKSTLQCYKKLDEVYNYAYKPFPADVDRIIARLGPRLKKVFLKIFKEEVSGRGSINNPGAFSKNNKYYTNRASFNKDYKLNPSKKNVFVMLHAFNDQPHSTFRWMIFKDYYDWFVKTLEFAKKNNKVNWIFKQHPEIKYYPVKDVNFKKLFSRCPDNVIYIDENKQIDTRSLIHCADLVVTCLGSAGFELPAMGAIPSVTAGDNFYTQLGFALEPKTKEEYFDILNKADKIERLTPQAQEKAQAAYIYIYRFSRVDISVCPMLSFDQGKDKNINSWYWKKAAKLYREKKDIFLREVKSYINDVSQPSFKRLTSFKNYQL
jgi:hypothetical protein